MSLVVEVLNGGGTAAGTAVLTTRLRADLGMSLGNRAYDGQGASGSLIFDDDDGEYGNSNALPVGLTALSVAAHNRIWVLEDATTPDTYLLNGRVGEKAIGRGDLHQDRGRQVRLTVEDSNSHLRGITLTSDQARSSESDVTRATWVLTTYLQGDPRLTTDLTSRIINANTVTMPAKTYEAGTPIIDILRDCATAAGKTFFVYNEGNGTMSLYYATNDDTSLAAAIRISDDDDEINFGLDAGGTALSCSGAGGSIPTPNGGFEDGNTDNWNGAVLQSSPANGGALGTDYWASTNTLDPQWRYTGWVGQTFNSGETYRFVFYILGSGAQRVRIGDLELDGSSASGDYEEWAGTGQPIAGGVWESHEINWTPSANRTAVRLVHDKPGHGELGIDQVELLAASCTFPPIWVNDTASTENGLGLLSGGVLRHGGGAVYSNDQAIVDAYDYHVEPINDIQAVDAADGTARLTKMLSLRNTEDRTYTVAVQLHRSQVGYVHAGDLIDIKARAIPDADDQYRTRRIASLEWQWIGPEHYYAVMELDRPLVGVGNPGSSGANKAEVSAVQKADAAVTAHESASDPHSGYVREADANWIDLTDSGETSLHSHAGGGSGLIIEEGDGSPTGTATKLVLPNGTLGFSGGTATYTPTSTSGIIVQEDGVAEGTATVLNYSTNLNLSYSGGTATITADSGGVGWTLAVNESGASFANFTALSGTWASNGTIIQQTATGAAVRRAKYNTRLATNDMVIQADFRFPSGGASTIAIAYFIGWPGTDVANFPIVGLIIDGPTTVNAQQDALATVFNIAATINADTWYTLRTRVSGTKITTYLDGTLVASGHFGEGTISNYDASFVGFRAFDATVDIRNFKVWTLDLPA